ncbi:Tol-Pal system beta propeller repeat protein TolB [Gemmobacter denitrificans]|uniref:Tol-Pal system protein TolB n=1 Tax=Gemmobacter denitrificans TaxID=3123040 RepID=A0ABU8BUG8_9RHOB
MLATPAEARLTITLGSPVIEPMPFALPTFVDEGGAGELAANISSVIAADLAGTGLFAQIPPNAYIQQITSFDTAVSYPDWQAINAQALITGAVQASGGQVAVKFCLHDVFANGTLEDCLQFAGDAGSWRRVAHKVADAVYSRITGESGYFDSRVVFVSEAGPKSERQKRLAVMDYDGANVSYLTDSSSIVLAPRFSPAGDRILFTSYSSGFPQIYVMDVANLAIRGLGEQPGTMTFAPRFSPDGQTVVFSLERGGNTDIYSLNVNGGGLRQLTNSPAIETAPSFSPDGSQIVFESDRSGNQQLYVMPASGGEGTRISGGAGRYGTPVWSPRGDYIAFTKQNAGRFHIGVMLADGTEEKLLTSSYIDEGPTWSPNGRVIMFTRQDPGGDPMLYSVDVSGRNLKRIQTGTAASDPAWSPLLP